MLEALNIWLGDEVSDERVFQQLAQAIQQHKACEKKWVFLVDDAHVLTELDLNHCCHLFSLLHNSLGAAREDACFHRTHWAAAIDAAIESVELEPTQLHEIGWLSTIPF